MGWMIIVDEILGRPNYCIVRRTIERWDGDSFLVAVHYCPMKYTLVTIVAYNLQLPHILLFRISNFILQRINCFIESLHTFLFPLSFRMHASLKSSLSFSFFLLIINNLIYYWAFNVTTFAINRQHLCIQFIKKKLY